jgi:hypothetical protein
MQLIKNGTVKHGFDVIESPRDVRSIEHAMIINDLNAHAARGLDRPKRQRRRQRRYGMDLLGS